ncbi:MAG TPA: menaquinone biosynthesis protein [Pyrinomonadaceae bacterium]|nr:menaquinone biosynthesis protein [Pyrinomonadaceae bacterium]
MRRVSEGAGIDRGVRAAPRVAASSYLNTAPLIWSFASGRRRGEVELLTDTAPARCADMLARGQVEAALVPVIEYQRLPEAAVVPGVCVGARREVHSVVLVTRGARLEDVNSVALSTESRTSAALVEVIFREFVGRLPRLEPAAPSLGEMLRGHDAALVIGDPAMTFRREGLRVYDMAALWREFTGLGFVFAMWMAHESAAPRMGHVDFAAARDEGLARVEEIAAEYEAELGRPRAELVSYLTRNICFELDEGMRAGLELFFRLAHKHGVTRGLRPLKFLGTGGA